MQKIYAVFKQEGTLAWSMLKFTISEIIGANVDEQSFNNIAGTGSNEQDLGGNLRRRDRISSGSVGFRISREAEVRDLCDDSSGQRLSQMVFTLVLKYLMKVSAIAELSV